MAQATAKTAPAAKEEAIADGAFVIQPRDVVLNSDGFGWRSFLIRMPQGATADVLKDPGLFRKIQSARGKTLRLLDEVRLVAFDQTWMAEAVVADADNVKVVLSVGKIHKLESSRFDRLYEDDLYKIQWNGAGFVVVRKSDLHVMTRAQASAALAERDLVQLYPRAVAA